MVPVLVIAFLGVLLLIVVRRRNLGLLLQIASLIGAVLVLIWLQDRGLLNDRGGGRTIEGKPGAEAPER